MLWILMTPSLYGQVGNRFERLSTASGLSQSSIYKIIQDKKGFLWFATADGLNRYDGHNFKIFRNDPSDPATLSGSDIFSIVEDDEGNIWVGTRSSGLNHLDLLTGKITRFTRGPNGQDISNLNIPSLINLGNHRVGVAALGFGLLVYQTQSKKLLPTESEWKNPLVKEVVRTFKHSNGSLWLGTRTGQLISVLGKHSFMPFSLGQNQVKSRIRAIFEAKNGEILVGTDGAGLFQFNPTNQKFRSVFYQSSNPLARQNIVTSITRDALRNLWIGTDNGVYVMEGDDFKRFKHIPSNPDPELGISSFSVMSLFTDSNLNTWIGTYEAGLNISFFQKPRFSVLRYKPNTTQGLLSNKVSALAAADASGVWIGSNLGLSFFDHKSRKLNHVIYSESANKLSAAGDYDVNFLKAMPNGEVWVGFWGKGLNHLSPSKKLTDHPFLPGRREANFNCMLPFQNQILLGSVGLGVISFDPQSKRYAIPYPELGIKTFQNRAISDLAFIDGGQIWIGTIGFGLYQFDLKSRQLNHLVKSANPNSLSYNHVTQIYQDKQKRVWVLTNGGGVNLYQPENKDFRTLTVKDGLSSNTVRGVAEDGKGDLWFTTTNGISKMDGKTLRFINFEDADGLQGKEFTAKTFAANNQNWLFFGGVNGLNYLKSDSLRMRLDVPDVYVTSFKLFNQEVEPDQENSPLTFDISRTSHITLQPGQSVFSLDFVALEYQRPKNNRYAYYLEGFEKDWNYVGTTRTATYTNLSPGDYTFKVKASNSDGIWSEKPMELLITVLPPWYRTWWAYGGYVLLLIAAIYLFIREVKIREAFKTDIRMKEIEKERIRELEQVKTHFFTNISHELRTPLTLIISPIEKYFMQNASLSGTQEKRISSIYQNAQKLLRLINQLLDLSKIESGKQQPVIAKHDLVLQMNGIIQGFENYAQQKQIKLTWKVPTSSLLVYYDADILEKCVSNLLSNAFKHTPEDGKIGVSLALASLFVDGNEEVNQIHIRVIDTGKGIATEHVPHIFDRFYQIPESMSVVGTGVGLSLCKELVTLHLGEIEVKSTLGVGSEFGIRIPVRKSYFDPSWVQEKLMTIKSQEQITAPSDSIEKEKQILLIVDDHTELRKFVAEIFESKFQVMEASRGEDALEMALTYLPDVVITDWMMPGMSGVNLCRALRQNPKTNHIPLVLLTSKSAQESQIEGMQAGADDFVSKPFNADILEIRVNKLLESKERNRKNWQKQMIQQELSEGKLPTFEDAFLVKATQLIIANLSNADFDVEDLEKGLDMSKMQLYRKMKMLTSLAANEFIRSIRLQQAKVLLENSKFNISEIAYQVGFNDPAYFARAFKKQYGKTPKSFIKPTHEEN
jgi:signal transduction histidine kinase/ligand-binding sensor domain-containing protein/DNA-binding response OmpR family regulator